MAENAVAVSARELLGSRVTDLDSYRIALDLCATEISRLTIANSGLVRTTLDLTQTVTRLENQLLSAGAALP